MRRLNTYPYFHYEHSILTEGRVIILDEALSLEKQGELQRLKTIDGNELLFLGDSQLANDVEKILMNIVEGEDEILFVFPGNGAGYPRKFSEVCKKFRGVEVFAKRFWQPGSDPVVMVGSILPEIFLITSVKTIVVVDDAISSGLTMQKLHRNNAWRFPRAKWKGVAWVSQFPPMRARSGVNGYEQISTACLISKPDGAKAPLNSISTLRKNPEIAKSYAERHFLNPRQFLNLINI